MLKVHQPEVIFLSQAIKNSVESLPAMIETNNIGLQNMKHKQL